MAAKSKDVTNESLIHMYVDEKKSYKEISLIVGMSVPGIRKRLIKNGVTPRRRGAHHTGAEHPKWKGGSFIREGGYKSIMNPEKTCKNDRYVLEHRYVWEKAYGKLPKGMVIHHINGNRLDNRLENLQALTHAENCQRTNLYIQRIKELEDENTRLKEMIKNGQ